MRGSFRNVASDAGPIRAGHAIQTSLGRTRFSGGRPSWEGYMDAPATHLSIEKSGYQNPANQRARMINQAKNKARRASAPVQGSSFNVKYTSKKIFDYRYAGSGNNSVSKLSKLTRLNKLF